MTKIIASLVLATASAIGFASKAEASPTGIGSIHVLPRGSVRIGIGTGYGYGGGYGGYGYGGYGYSGGYYRTEYQWVQETVLVGYDRFGNPMYATNWVQQPVQVWVPTYVPVYRPVYGGISGCAPKNAWTSRYSPSVKRPRKSRSRRTDELRIPRITCASILSKGRPRAMEPGTPPQTSAQASGSRGAPFRSLQECS